MPNAPAPTSYVDTTFWEKQGGNAFVKAKTDWLNIGKIHLSFVRYNKETNKSLSSIEAAIPIGFKSGCSALSLIGDVLSGDIAKKRAKSLATQQKTGAKYAPPFFEYWGGSKGKSRRVTMQPGSRTAYVLQVQECDGVTNGKGAIQPKEGAPQTYISIGLTDEDVKSMACAMQILLSSAPGLFTFGSRQVENGADIALPEDEYPPFPDCEPPQSQSAPRPVQQPQQSLMQPPAQAAAPRQAQSSSVQQTVQQPVAQPATPQTTLTELVISFDQTSELFVVATREKFPEKFKEGLRKLLHSPQPYKLPPENCEPLMAAVANGDKELPYAVTVKKDGDAGNAQNTISSYIVPFMLPVNGQACEVIVSYDQLGEVFIVTSRENFVDAIKTAIRKILQSEYKYIVSADDFNRLVTAVTNGSTELPPTNAVSKVDKRRSDILVSRVEVVST